MADLGASITTLGRTVVAAGAGAGSLTGRGPLSVRRSRVSVQVPSAPAVKVSSRWAVNRGCARLTCVYASL